MPMVTSVTIIWLIRGLRKTSGHALGIIVICPRLIDAGRTNSDMKSNLEADFGAARAGRLSWQTSVPVLADRRLAAMASRGFHA